MRHYPSIKSFVFRNAYLLILAAWFITFSFLFQYYWSYTSAPEQVRKTIQAQISDRTNDFEELLNNTARLTRFIQARYNKEDFEFVYKKDYFIFLAQMGSDGAEVKYWNTNTIIPTTDLWLRDDGEWFEKLINGYYVVYKKTITLSNGGSAMVIALIPVKWEYFVTNNYLNNNFAYLPSIEKYYTVTQSVPTSLAVSGTNGKELFWLTERKGSTQPLSPVTLLLRLLGVLVAFIFIHRFSLQIKQQYSFLPGLMFLVLVLASLRLLSYYYPVPVNLRQFEMFDPAIYGSNLILKSLGDLLLNALLLIWVLLYMYQFGPVLKLPARVNPYVSAGFLSAAIFLLTILFGNIVRSLVSDSQISFNVTNFFSLNFYSFIGFFVLGCLVVIYFLIIRALFVLLKEATGASVFIQLLYFSVTGFLYLTITFSSGAVLYNLGLLIWLLVFTVISQTSGLITKVVPNGGRTIFFVFLYSVSLTILLVNENNYREWTDRKRMAEKLSLQTDPSAENLLSIALNNFRGDFLQTNFSRFRISGTNRFLKDSLLNENFSGYLNKYNTRLFTFDEDEQPLFNEDSTSFNTLNTIYNLQSKQATVKDWKYYEESFDKFYYLARKEVIDTTTFKVKGTVFLLSKPKTYADEKFYPELFSKNFNLQTESSPAYAYALYKNNELISSYNDYDFPIHLPKSFSQQTGFVKQNRNNYSELWYLTSADRAVVIVRRQNGVLQFITLFAYLFFVFLFMWVLYQAISFFLQAGRSWARWKKIAELNFRSQVQTTIIAISLISFLVIGVSTIFFFINRHNRTNRERLSRTIQIMQSEVELALLQHATFDDVLKVYDEVSNAELQNKVNRISEIHGVDVNVYDPQGNLRLSSQPYYYNKGLLSRKMEPRAVYDLSRRFLVQTIEQEKVGTQSYMSIYVPVRDEAGQTYAYVNIPYFTSQNELKLEISSFLVTLINLNAFIFLIAGLIAFLVTNRITASFSFISDKMKEMKLGKANEAIVWKRNDEIGELVQEYNKMVNKLEESAALFARNEREDAWREMARQVAHEIKNPLTPMKLSIQYLQRAIATNSADTKTISQNVAKTLVEQIDYLSNIASDFSSFANIANPRIEKVNLTESLKSVVDLFTMDERAEIYYDLSVAETVFVMGDKTQLNRLFTNLVRNAIEAVPPYRKAKIVLRYELNNGEVITEVKDNGEGIPDELRIKIFYPNFTTKTSGTGLGLAMCKGIVEQMKGEIWFETETGKGTTFFVKLPRV